jgi:hypothetical protein
MGIALMTDVERFCILYGKYPVEIPGKGWEFSQYLQVLCSHEQSGLFMKLRIVEGLKAAMYVPRVDLTVAQVEGIGSLDYELDSHCRKT